MVLHNLLYSKGYNFQELFIKDLWNPRWTSRKSRWTIGGQLGPCWESVVQTKRHSRKDLWSSTTDKWRIIYRFIRQQMQVVFKHVCRVYKQATTQNLTGKRIKYRWPLTISFWRNQDASNYHLYDVAHPLETELLAAVRLLLNNDHQPFVL